MAHPEISDVKVIEIPDPETGEEFMAWIIKKSGSDLTSNGVIEYCTKHITNQYVPKYIEFTDEFPMTVSGKIQKVKLLDQAMELIRKNKK